ncbi:MAG: hypothetical protein ABR592_09350 [Nitriliruptorales bacterium]
MKATAEASPDINDEFGELRLVGIEHAKIDDDQNLATAEDRPRPYGQQFDARCPATTHSRPNQCITTCMRGCGRSTQPGSSPTPTQLQPAPEGGNQRDAYLTQVLTLRVYSP